MDATEQSLRQSLSEKSSSVEAQGNAIHSLKASHAAKPEIDTAIELLNKLKLEKSAVEKQLQFTISSFGTCFRANYLLKDYCNEKLEKDLTISAEKAAELKDVLAVLEDFSTEQLGAKIKEYGITAPDMKNPPSDPYPFNLMFQTSSGPSALIPG